VQILQPQTLRVEVPEDGELKVEVRALDPDYGLSAVRLEGTVAGKPPLKIDLLPTSDVPPPQATIPHLFRPRDHKLSAGDELKYVAVAEDNRVNSHSGQPEPRGARTRTRMVVVALRHSSRIRAGQQNQQPMGGQDQEPRPKNQDRNQTAGSRISSRRMRPKSAADESGRPGSGTRWAQQESDGGQQNNPMGGQQQTQWAANNSRIP
jgi:hypothetical protein